MIPLLGAPPVPWEVLGGLLAGLAALVTALAGVAKVLAEVRAARRDTARARAETAELAEQFVENHGSSARDSWNRIESSAGQTAVEIRALRDDVADIRQATLRHDRELARANDALGQLGVRITSTEARLASQLDDHSERMHALETLELNRRLGGRHGEGV